MFFLIATYCDFFANGWTLPEPEKSKVRGKSWFNRLKGPGHSVSFLLFPTCLFLFGGPPSKPIRSPHHEVVDAFLELDTSRRGTIRLHELRDVLSGFDIPDQAVGSPVATPFCLQT